MSAGAHLVQTAIRGDESGDECHGVDARGVDGGCIFEGDAANGNKGAGGEAAECGESGEAHHRIGVVFGVGGENGPDGEVVHRLSGRELELGGVVGGKADEGGWAEEAAGGGRGQVVLAEMEAGLREKCEVGAIIQNKGGPGGGTNVREFTNVAKECAGKVRFVTKLQQCNAGGEERVSSGEQGYGSPLERCAVKNWVKRRKRSGEQQAT